MSTPIVELTLKCDGNKHCHQPATRIAHIHQVNACDAEHLTPYGNTVHLLCNHCLRAAIELFTRQISRRNKGLPKGVGVCCRTCGKPIATVNDVVEIEEI